MMEQAEFDKIQTLGRLFLKRERLTKIKTLGSDMDAAIANPSAYFTESEIATGFAEVLKCRKEGLTSSYSDFQNKLTTHPVSFKEFRKARLAAEEAL